MFSGDESTWGDWSFKLRSYVSVVDVQLGRMMEAAELAAHASVWIKKSNKKKHTHTPNPHPRPHAHTYRPAHPHTNTPNPHPHPQTMTPRKHDFKNKPKKKYAFNFQMVHRITATHNALCLLHFAAAFIVVRTKTSILKPSTHTHQHTHRQ